MTYCGVVTPYREVRVYVPSALGMPGFENVLEELMCLVRGYLLKQGTIVRITADLYCGENTSSELLEN